MASNYRKLGEFIEQTDERNDGLKTTNLLGVSIEKKFVPSIANIVGTDLTKYKVVHGGEFAYGPVTSRNGDKVSIARLDDDMCIISSSYTSFKVIGKELLPEYLMLWFMRPEFDRYARFKSHGSAREIFDWEQMCAVELPVPTVEKQQRIIDRFAAIQGRIDTLEQLNDKLAASSNDMFAKLLEEHDSASWNKGTLSELATIKYGKDHSQLDAGPYPVYGSGGIMRYAETFLYDKVSVLIPRKGTLNNVLFVDEPFWSVDTMFYTQVKSRSIAMYVYQSIKDYDFAAQDTGTSIPSNSTKTLNALPMPMPTEGFLYDLEAQFEPIYAAQKANSREIETLAKVRHLLLTRLAV